MPYSISGHSIDAAVRNPNDMRRLLHGIAQRIAIYDDQLGIFDGFLDDPSDVPASKPAPPAISDIGVRHGSVPFLSLIVSYAMATIPLSKQDCVSSLEAAK